MENLNRLYDKLDKIEEHIASIDKTLVAQNLTLEEHTRRSKANEEAVDMLKHEFKPIYLQSYLIRTSTKIIVGILSSGLLIELVAHFLK